MDDCSSSSEDEKCAHSSQDQTCFSKFGPSVLSHPPKLSESDMEIWTDYLGDYVDMWLRNGPRFFEDQKYKMVRLALCPFLFNITDNLPRVWINVLSNFGILGRERSDDRILLSASEMESFEMAELIFKRCADLTVESKNDLKEILNFIYDIEERPGSGERIDVYYALDRLPDLKLFHSIW
ncbi:26S proteasome non-ATPase regulatory subunit 9-like [Plakobranchus ocellatus]|uniref:26S proteasome non-ATPase regulatory subunit 9-like n=1 Tax=Plakobranchus ocellatus TaxID=259542 RepID=A0AAV4CEU0_9GAST|nr:26S proteasome non-ATPase regulatory subunit 9-like [Plakobranchus ocellatus]